MDLHIPKSDLNIPRHEMPQLGATDTFLTQLRKSKVPFKSEEVAPNRLKAVQGEFNVEIIKNIINNPRPTRSSIVISKDNYVIDGNHRWIANLNMKKKTHVVRVDMNARDLIKLAKSFPTTTYKNVHQMNEALKRLAAASFKPVTSSTEKS